jgi:hypothetical protein
MLRGIVDPDTTYPMHSSQIEFLFRNDPILAFPEFRELYSKYLFKRYCTITGAVHIRLKNNAKKISQNNRESGTLFHRIHS